MLSNWCISLYSRSFPVYKDQKSSQTNKTNEDIFILTAASCSSSPNLSGQHEDKTYANLNYFWLSVEVKSGIEENTLQPQNTSGYLSFPTGLGSAGFLANTYVKLTVIGTSHICKKWLICCLFPGFILPNVFCLSHLVVFFPVIHDLPKTSSLLVIFSFNFELFQGEVKILDNDY